MSATAPETAPPPAPMHRSLPTYHPLAFHDFTDPEPLGKMTAALKSVRGQLGRTYPNLIGGQPVTGGERLDSINPAHKTEVVGSFGLATQADAERAIRAAAAAFPSWSRVSAEERADYLFRAAQIMRDRHFELCAWMTVEAGKNFAEADADTAEAIDFLEFYAREALRYCAPQPVVPSPLGETNELIYIPLGVGVVLPPWNFPLAITVGMTAAAIVTGNTVVLKPSEDAPVIAAKFIEILQEVGLPAGVVNFLAGRGSEIGDFMVDHPTTRFVSFTGSRAVGCRVYARAAVVHPGQRWLKRVVAEMGGKDAIVVDASADLERAAEGIVASAFGFSGQKCSACSRAILVDAIYDEVLAKVIERTGKMTVGDPAGNPQMGPVSSERAFRRIREYQQLGRSEGRLVAGGSGDDTEGFYIEPTVFADIQPDARLAQEEIFGPVLSVIRARDLDHAFEIANGTDYGLTGGFFSDDPAALNRAKREFHVGNLYLNRKCTGALVGVHPFGGFNMSGTDSKAGGRDYLLLFMQAKSIAEKHDADGCPVSGRGQ